MLTVSIVTYHNPIYEIDSLLDSILLTRIDRIFIIDNSKNDLLRILEKKSPKIQYIHSQNIGYGSAHNIAIREAISMGSIYHIIVNPDIQFEPDVIDKLCTYMDLNNDIGQIMPKIVYPNGELQYLCKMVPTPMDLIFKRFIPKCFTRKKIHKFQLRFTGYNKVMNIPYLSGCFMFFRVSALKDVGMFDERFFMYPEDIDITRRMHSKYKTIFYPEVSIIHVHAAESYKSKKMLWIHIINMIKYFNKWGWLHDSERRCINNKLLKELGYKK